MSAVAPSRRVVTVDGPAGSGKSTLGRRLGVALGLPLIDTGLFYRGVMVAAVRRGMDRASDADLEALAANADIEVNTDPAGAGGWTLRVDGRHAGDEARDPAHALLLSRVSGVPGVRRALLDRQRAPARNGAVAVGRDCGTVVFPDARVKFYLDAPGDVRTARRGRQLAARGHAVGRSELEREVAGRDAMDMATAASPRAAPDAVHIDTGAVGVEEMVARALELCRRAGIAGGA